MDMGKEGFYRCLAHFARYSSKGAIMKRFMLSLVLVAFVVIVGCKSKETAPESTDVGGEKSMGGAKVWEEPKQAAVDAGKKYIAVIRTSKGEIECELFPKDAPLSVTNFKYLADNGFYKGLAFHRVVPGFVIQGGDPTGTGAGGPGYTMPAEINPAHKHVKGALAWARTGDEVNPERRSSGSQFYITLAPTPFLDNGYTVFGQTVKGLDVVDKIQAGDKIESVEVKME